MKITIAKVPNILTTIRIILVPIFCVFMWIDTTASRIVAIVLIAIACITDFLDGKIARKYNVVSNFGRCLDPIADKVLVMSIIVMLVSVEKAWVIPSIAILFREFVVSGIREFAAKDKISIPVSKLAKIKTTAQMISLLFLVIAGTNMIALFIGNCLLCIAAVLSVITSIQYIKSVKYIFE